MINQKTIKSDLKKAVVDNDRKFNLNLQGKLENFPELAIALQEYHEASLNVLLEVIKVEKITTQEAFNFTVMMIRRGICCLSNDIMNADCLRH